MTSARDLLMKRKTEITAQLGPLFGESLALRKKLVELESSINKGKHELQEIELALKAMDEAQAKSSHLTIMQATLEILKHRPEGMTAREILAELNSNYFDNRIARHSLSPQLSRLKDRDKKIELRGNRWFRLPDEPSLFASKS